MILVDTSIWIEHLRRGLPALEALLESNMVLMHPAVVGELACGNLRNRAEVLDLLKSLPQLSVATDEEVLTMIERHQLMGRGIGYIDAHLLTCTKIHAAKLWTGDKRLYELALGLKLAHPSEAH